MKKGERGLSTIVVTLIIILISLVAVGVVWVVVNNLIKSGTTGVDINAKCLSIIIEPTKVNCSSASGIAYCSVDLMRTGTGSDVIEGVKMVFKNSTSGLSSGLIILRGNVEQLVGKKQTGVNTTISDADTLEVTAFLKDSSGNEQNCPQTGSFNNFS